MCSIGSMVSICSTCISHLDLHLLFFFTSSTLFFSSFLATPLLPLSPLLFSFSPHLLLFSTYTPRLQFDLHLFLLLPHLLSTPPYFSVLLPSHLLLLYVRSLPFHLLSVSSAPPFVETTPAPPGPLHLPVSFSVKHLFYHITHRLFFVFSPPPSYFLHLLSSFLLSLTPPLLHFVSVYFLSSSPVKISSVPPVFWSILSVSSSPSLPPAAGGAAVCLQQQQHIGVLAEGAGGERGGAAERC